jgi:YD repeat-containing protein
VRYAYAPLGELIEIFDAATDKRSSYRFDAAGRRISERTVQQGALYQNNRLVYDALGQLTQVTDTSAGRAQLRILYDAAGNRQRIITDISADGTGANPYHGDGWYRHDAMNRQVVVNAIDADGNPGNQGHRLAYDLNGNRISDTWWGTRLTPPLPGTKWKTKAH